MIPEYPCADQSNGKCSKSRLNESAISNTKREQILRVLIGVRDRPRQTVWEHLAKPDTPLCGLRILNLLSISHNSGLPEE